MKHKIFYFLLIALAVLLITVGIWAKVAIIGIPKPLGPHNYEYNKEEMHVSYDGIDLYGMAIIPESKTEKKFPTVIFAHGAESDYKADMTTLESLAASGIACYTFDFYGWTSRSTGPKGTHWFKNIPRRVDDSYEIKVLQQVDDLNAVIKAVRNFDFVDTTNIFLLGSSMGGATVAAAAISHSKDVNGIILQYPAINLVPTAMIQGGAYDVNKYEGDVLLLQGDNDNIVPLEMSDKLSEYYNQLRKDHSEYIVYKGQPHVFRGKYKVLAAKDMYDFITKRIVHKKVNY